MLEIRSISGWVSAHQLGFRLNVGWFLVVYMKKLRHIPCDIKKFLSLLKIKKKINSASGDHRALQC